MDTNKNNNKKKSGAARMKDTNKKKLFEISTSCQKISDMFSKNETKIKTNIAVNQVSDSNLYFLYCHKLMNLLTYKL